MEIKDSKIYDAKSFASFAKSLKDNFMRSNSLKEHYDRLPGFQFNDAAVASSGAYLEYQLTHIIPKVLTQVFPGLPALKTFAVSNEGALEKMILRRMKSWSGEHTREIENKSDAKGVITTSYDATGILVEDLEASSFYTEVDLMRAALFNDPLDASLIEGHNRSYNNYVDNLAFLGMKNEAGTTIVEGLLNNTGVDSGLTGNATASFTGMNGTTMYANVAALINAIQGKCQGAEELWPDTITTSPRILSILNTTTYGTIGADVQNPKSIATMIKENLGITMLNATKRCSALDFGTLGGDRLCAYNRREDVMTLSIPMPLKFSEIFKECFKYKFSSMFRAAGLMINQKVAFGYLKGC